MRRVSVVVPSYQRHHEVMRAVASALVQSVSPLEVIVVNDGTDPEKGRLLEAFGDDRVRYMEAPRRGNAAATRNFGIRYARGGWVALLDDDDVWRPEKLALQFSALDQSGHEEALVAGVEALYAQGKRCHVRPGQTIPPDVSMSEFLFCGTGGANTSTLLAPRWAFENDPFDEELERHEDWSWMLRVGQVVRLVVAPEEVCIRYVSPGEGVSRPGGYEVSRRWYETHKKLMTPRARAAFVANVLSRKGAFDYRVSAIPWLVREIRENRGFGYDNVVRMTAPWIVPASVRRVIKSMMAGP